MHPRISESIGHGRPKVERGEHGWLIVTRHPDTRELHVWSWRPLHKWHEAVQFAIDLAWEMAEFVWNDDDD